VGSPARYIETHAPDDQSLNGTVSEVSPNYSAAIETARAPSLKLIACR
jgi:hypothetical protein